jgi:hypothetical protein
VQGDDGPHFGEGSDAVGDPGGSRAGGGARHGVSGCEPSARDSLSSILRELTERAVRALFLLGWDECTEIFTVSFAELVYIGVRPALSSLWLRGGIRTSRL